MKPYYQDDSVTIYHGDCREVLPALAIDGRVVTVTDPPYGRTTSLAWDAWVDGWPQLVPGDSLWSFGSMRMFLERWADFDGWSFGQDIVWRKHNGSSFHVDRFRRIHESAVHLFKGPWADQITTTPTTQDATKRQVRRKTRPPHMGSIDASSYRSEDGGPRLMTTVIEVASCHGYADHPTQKPEGIVRPLVEFSSEPGDLILDPFMGSGTTLRVAIDSGRRAIGIETDEHFCEVAAKRCAQGALAL